MAELEKKAEAYVSEKSDKGNFDVEKFGKAYFSESSMKQALVKFAEPREKRIAELEKENEQLRADYDKQKEINKELVDDIADLHKRIRELETQIKQANEREAQDIRARFPC